MMWGMEDLMFSVYMTTQYVYEIAFIAFTLFDLVVAYELIHMIYKQSLPYQGFEWKCYAPDKL